MFAISFKSMSHIRLISTRRLLEEGMHPPNTESSWIKIEGHKGPITCMRWANFENSSHKLLSSSEDSSIAQWDIEKIVLEREMKYHRGSVQAITPLFNYSSTWGEGPTVVNMTSSIASASLDGYIFIWDHRTSSPVNKIAPNQK